MDNAVRDEARKWIRPWVLIGANTTDAEATRITDGILNALASAGLLHEPTQHRQEQQ